MEKGFIVLAGIINIWWGLAIFHSIYNGYCGADSFWITFGIFLLFVGILMTLYYGRLHWPTSNTDTSRLFPSNIVEDFFTFIPWKQNATDISIE